jgi:hypothetical protein
VLQRIKNQKECNRLKKDWLETNKTKLKDSERTENDVREVKEGGHEKCFILYKEGDILPGFY